MGRSKSVTRIYLPSEKKKKAHKSAAFPSWQIAQLAGAEQANWNDPEKKEKKHTSNWGVPLRNRTPKRFIPFLIPYRTSKERDLLTFSLVFPPFGRRLVQVPSSKRPCLRNKSRPFGPQRAHPERATPVLRSAAPA